MLSVKVVEQRLGSVQERRSFYYWKPESVGGYGGSNSGGSVVVEARLW